MTRIAIGADHAGFPLKQHLVALLAEQGHDVDDQGTHSTESVDYPAICAGVGRTVRDGDADVGIVLGGSGQGGTGVGAQERVVRQGLREYRFDVAGVSALQNKVRRLPGTIAQDQNRNLLLGQAPLGCLATSAPWRSGSSTR